MDESPHKLSYASRERRAPRNVWAAVAIIGASLIFLYTFPLLLKPRWYRSRVESLAPFWMVVAFVILVPGLLGLQRKYSRGRRLAKVAIVLELAAFVCVLVVLLR